MTNLDDNRLVQAFSELRAAGEKTLIPFLTAGHPDVETTAALLSEVERRGARICGLGVPFSAPNADGPTIQASYTEALAGGISSAKVFDVVRQYRAADGPMALVAMVSYSIVFRHGVQAYLQEAREAGFDAVILPDLPLDETAMASSLAREAGLASVLLIAPTTPPERRVAIARHSTGFIYYMSIAGITGERTSLPDATIEGVRELRKHVETPICVGFGISSPEMVRTVCEEADGAIVGSAIVHRVSDARELPREQLAERVGSFVGKLMTGLT